MDWSRSRDSRFSVCKPQSRFDAHFLDGPPSCVLKSMVADRKDRIASFTISVNRSAGGNRFPSPHGLRHPDRVPRCPCGLGDSVIGWLCSSVTAKVRISRTCCAREASWLSRAVPGLARRHWSTLDARGPANWDVRRCGLQHVAATAGAPQTGQITPKHQRGSDDRRHMRDH